MADTSTLDRVTSLVAPIVTDLKLDLYDVEFRGGTLRITIDTPPGSPGGVDLEAIALATRLISRDLDHHDPVPGHYTLEVTSPGLERQLRLPKHFHREIGKTVALRLRDIGVGGERRISGVLIAADDDGITIRIDDAAPTERVVPYDHIDRARTVFVWGPAPKPGQPKPKANRPRSRDEGRGDASPAAQGDSGAADEPALARESGAADEVAEERES